MRFSSRALTLTLVSLFALPVLAQDTQGLVDRLNRIERDLNTLQSQVYRGQSGKVQSSGGSADAGVGAGGAYGMLDGRISQLEDQLRQVTGDLEKYQYDINQLKAKIDRLQQDDDFRFKQIEEKQSGGGGAAAPAAAAPAAAGAQPPGVGVDGNRQGPGSPPGFLGQPKTGDKPNAPPSAADAGALPAGKSAAEQYDYAFGLLRNSDYDSATRAFQAFLQQHPQDPLAGNSAFWLGQIEYAQGHYDQAAPIFLDAYRKYPKSAKAAESLLKVGLSMGNLGKKAESCAALKRFQTEFPDAADNLRKQAAAERSKQGC